MSIGLKQVEPGGRDGAPASNRYGPGPAMDAKNYSARLFGRVWTVCTTEMLRRANAASQ